MCELCNLEKRTEWSYEDNYLIVCKCEICKILRIIDKKHTIELNLEILSISKDQIYVLSNLIKKIISKNKLVLRFLYGRELLDFRKWENIKKSKLILNNKK